MVWLLLVEHIDSLSMLTSYSLSGFTDETPRDYQCNLGPDGRRRDADERPELCRGTVEFVATREFMVRITAAS